MTRDSYYAQAPQGRSRNPRSYRKDDSYHNAVGAVSGFFAGLLGVTLALGGTASLLFGGAAVFSTTSMDTQASYCLEGSKSFGCQEGDREEMFMISFFALIVGVSGLTISSQIMRNYNN